MISDCFMKIERSQSIDRFHVDESSAFMIRRNILLLEEKS